MDALLGVVLVVLGVAGALFAVHRFDQAGRARLAPVAVAPMGVLIGGGAALVRGWNPTGSAIAGMVVLPLLTLASSRLGRPRQ